MARFHRPHTKPVTRPHNRRRLGVVPFLLLLLLLLCAGLFAYGFLQAKQADTQAGESLDLTVTFLDVGQGDAALLESRGEIMLIDGGPKAASEALIEALAARGIDHIDCMVATHPHEDHIGGLSAVPEAMPVALCRMPDDAADTQTFTDFLLSLEAQEVPVELTGAGERFPFGDCTVSVLAPAELDEEEHNNNSLVLRVQCGSTAFLFTGDMEAAEESALLASHQKLSAQVLKVAHHGSGYTSSDAFLKAVGCDYAVISCGAGNDYGHPHEELLERLEGHHARILRTDEQGSITIHSDGRKLTVRTQQEEKP